MLTIKRLGQAGHADEQGVDAAEDRHQQLIEHVFLPDDDLADLGPHLLVGRAKFFQHLHVGSRHGWGRSRGTHGSFLED